MSGNEKKTIRKQIKLLFAAAGTDELARQSADIFKRLEADDTFAGSRVIALYHSLPDEPDSSDFIRRWHGLREIVLPCVNGDEMVFRRYDGSTRDGCFGICEPTGNEVAPENIDLMIVPGVAFDRHGRRLGRGKGYYDRYLSRTNITTVGVCFDFQLMDRIPHEPHDRKVDKVITAGNDSCSPICAPLNKNE